jgi:hypothetical protein
MGSNGKRKTRGIKEILGGKENGEENAQKARKYNKNTKQQRKDAKKHWGGVLRPNKTQKRAAETVDSARRCEELTRRYEHKADGSAIDRRQAPKRIAARGKARELRTEHIDDECRGRAHRRVGA